MSHFPTTSTTILLLSLVASIHSSLLDILAARPDIANEAVQHYNSLLKTKEAQLCKSTGAYHTVDAELERTLTSDYVHCRVDPCDNRAVQIEYIRNIKRSYYREILSAQADVDYLGWKLAVQTLKSAQAAGDLKEAQLDELKKTVAIARKKVADRRRSQKGLHMVLPEERVAIKSMAAVGWLQPVAPCGKGVSGRHQQTPQQSTGEGVTSLWLLLGGAIFVMLFAIALVVLISVDLVKKARKSRPSEG